MKVSTVEIWEGEGNTRNKNASYEANQEGTFTLAVNFPSPIITLYVTTEDRLGRALQIERIFVAATSLRSGMHFASTCTNVISGQ